LSKRWFTYKELMESYTDGSYFQFDCGICTVPTKDILGLSLWPPAELLSDSKMGHLRESVNRKGWNDPYPGDLNLRRLPNGVYTVCEGGNHRPLLADELGIREIQANVVLVVPISMIDSKVLSEMEQKLRIIESLEKDAKDLNAFLQSQGIQRAFKYRELNEKYAQMWGQIDRIHDEREILLLNEALRLNLVNVHFGTRTLELSKNRLSTPKVNIRSYPS